MKTTEMADELARKTREGKVHWEQLGPRSYSAPLGHLAVVIAEDDGFFRLSFLKKSGEPIRRLIVSGLDQEYESFAELTQAACESAFSLDDVSEIQRALAAL